MEMWTRHKPSLHHVRKWGCPTLVLKPKVDKLKPRLDVCQLVGYPKGTKDCDFYNHIDQKVFVSINEKFMEDDYMMSNKAKSELNLRVLDETPTITKKTMSLIPTIPISSTLVSNRSGKVVIQSNQFIYLRESFEAILKEHELDSMDYDEAMSDVNAHL